MDAQYGLPQSASNKRRISLFIGCAAIVLLGVVACAWTTQRIAEGYGYHSALQGQLWPGSHFYVPWMCFIWQNIQDSQGIISRATTEGQCIFFIPIAFMVFYFLMFFRKPVGTKNIHGSARWATLPEIQEMGLLEGRGVYVGGWIRKFGGKEAFLRLTKGLHPFQTQLYLRHNGPEHVMAFMPTRSGKGVGLILPTLLAWLESTLVFDIKGENWALTSGYLKSMGHICLKFDPADATGSCARFNPVEEVRLSQVYAIPDAQNLVTMLIDKEGKGFEGKDAHWKQNAVALLAGVLLYTMIHVRLKENRTATLRDLAYMFGGFKRSEMDTFNEMLSVNHAENLDKIFGKNPVHAEIALFICAAGANIIKKPDSERGSVISTATTELALYKDPVVAANTAHSDFCIRDLMNNDKPVHLYLVVSPGEINRLRSLIRIIITQIIYQMTAHMSFSNGTSTASYKHRLLLMLDELPALGKIDILETAIAYIAGYGGKMYLIVQDILQLEKVYGKENAIMANCHVRIGSAPNIPQAGEFLSKLTGKTTVVEQKTSLSGDRAGHLKNASVSIQEVGRPLLTPDECMRLPAAKKDSDGKIRVPGDILVFVAGNPPIYGKQILYFRDPIFMARAMITAPASSDRIHGELPAPAEATKTAVAEVSETTTSEKSSESLYEKHFDSL